MSMIDGHEYFADSIGDIANPSSIMLLQGTWIVEISELAGFDRKEVAHIKAWLSRTTDRFVPKYESEPREVPRHYAVAGTHNPSGHGYLKDPTGARRFWPVPTGVIDLSRVRRDRDQIWAEAVALFRAGQKWSRGGTVGEPDRRDRAARHGAASAGRDGRIEYPRGAAE
jgi:predicted P-loop ATPase